jgi:hypothetical protein
MLSSALLILALAISASATAIPSRDADILICDTAPNTATSDLPLTILTVFQTLNVSTDALIPGIGITQRATPQQIRPHFRWTFE